MYYVSIRFFFSLHVFRNVFQFYLSDMIYDFNPNEQIFKVKPKIFEFIILSWKLPKKMANQYRNQEIAYISQF